MDMPSQHQREPKIWIVRTRFSPKRMLTLGVPQLKTAMFYENATLTLTNNMRAVIAVREVYTRR